MGKILGSDDIGKKIREYRQQAGFTQERLAEKLGITFQQVQKYERGLTKVNLTKLQQIAEVLKVPVSSFFEESSCTAYQLSEEEKQLLKAFRQINESLRNSVIEIVAGLKKKKP
jgi:transcriptional regulator with XRE-family HTH domain